MVILPISGWYTKYPIVVGGLTALDRLEIWCYILIKNCAAKAAAMSLALCFHDSGLNTIALLKPSGSGQNGMAHRFGQLGSGWGAPRFHSWFLFRFSKEELFISFLPRC